MPLQAGCCAVEATASRIRTGCHSRKPNMSEPKLFNSYSPVRPRQISRRPSGPPKRRFASTAMSSPILVTHSQVAPTSSVPAKVSAVSPVPTTRYRVERVEPNMPTDRKALQQALQGAQATLRAEARRAGAAEALLRERTATLNAVARNSRQQRETLRERSLQSPPLRLRSCSSSSSTVGSEMQVELACAITVRDRLAEKLTNAEREAQSLRSSKEQLEARVEREVQEAELLRSKVTSTEQQSSELRKQRLAIQQELQRAQSECDQLAITVAEGAARENVQQTELVQLSGQIEVLQSELAAKSCLLETASEQAKQLDRERKDLEVAFSSYQEHNGIGDNQQLKTIARLAQKVDQLTRQIESTETELGQEQGTTTELQARNSTLKQQLTAAEQQRMELHNTIQELKGNIRVYCRIRPSTPGSEVSLHQPEPNKMCLRHGLDTYGFNFDKVFGEDAAQAEVFHEVSGLVQSALDGYKVCIFAYGQTGSGKTYTMQGPPNGGEPGSEGLIPRALLSIFKASKEMKARGWSWSAKVSFMEVYNESLRDLLRGSGDAAAGPTDGYVIAQHDSWGTIVTGMTCIEVDSIDKINSLMMRAAKQRAVGATDVHATSSRSHSVFALYLKGYNENLGNEIHGALHLVDLAGSERLDKSGSTGERLKETRNINRSLSSLADVFAAKAEGRGHVPFRNSKLTHLMEPCLSGQGKTLMLVSVHPEQRNAHETLCSLRFAKQVSQCNTGGKPRRSVKNLQGSVGPSGNSSPRPSLESAQSRLPSKRNSLDRSAQQIPKRASSMEPVGSSLTPRGRASLQGHTFKRVESAERSPRGVSASSRPLTAREAREAREARLEA